MIGWLNFILKEWLTIISGRSSLKQLWKWFQIVSEERGPIWNHFCNLLVYIMKHPWAPTKPPRGQTLRSSYLCAYLNTDSSSPRISATLVGHFTGERDSLRKSSRFFHNNCADICQTPGSRNSLVHTACHNIIVLKIPGSRFRTKHINIVAYTSRDHLPT